MEDCISPVYARNLSFTDVRLGLDQECALKYSGTQYTIWHYIGQLSLFEKCQLDKQGYSITILYVCGCVCALCNDDACAMNISQHLVGEEWEWENAQQRSP